VTVQTDLFAGEALCPDLGFVSTPAWLTRAIVAKTILRPHGTILDAGAGTGAIAAELERLAGDGLLVSSVFPILPPKITAVEISQERCSTLPAHWEVICADFFEWSADYCNRRFDLIFTNPPFDNVEDGIWQSWVETCWPMAAEDLIVIGPLAYLSGQERGRWWKAMGSPGKMPRPISVLISPERPRGGAWDNTRDIMAVHWRRTGNAILGTYLDWLEV
jgi:SAM-dependent methyltransferase